jgi:hypothetical protein
MDDGSRCELERLADQAFVYGVALVEDVGKMVEQVTTPGIPLGASLNAFGHGRELFDARRGRELGLVGINTDTLYSWAQVDVGSEPMVLSVPDAGGRYYVMQFADAWTNDFAYVGARATGTEAGEFLIVGPGWVGDPPDGMPVIHAPTPVFSIVVRWAVADPADLPAVHALQDALRISELSGDGEPARRPGGVWPYPSPDSRVPGELAFWEKLRVWSHAFPPYPSEDDYLRRFAAPGLLARDSPYVDPDPELAEILRSAAAAGPETIITSSTELLAVRGQWLETRENFNFNQHFFELGTIDTPEWKIADRERAWLLRTRESLTAIWGNHAYEPYYPPCFHDADGQPLTGEHRHTLHFQAPPPADAFWSVTLCDQPGHFLVDNPIDRYAIGDRTPGVQINPDGSLDIDIGHDTPPDNEQANWLPAPTGAFMLALRIYRPRPEAFDQAAWTMPTVNATQAGQSA